MSINEVRYLPECGSTNAYVKEHFEEFGQVPPVGIILIFTVGNCWRSCSAT